MKLGNLGASIRRFDCVGRVIASTVIMGVLISFLVMVLSDRNLTSVALSQAFWIPLTGLLLVFSLSQASLSSTLTAGVEGLLIAILCAVISDNLENGMRFHRSKSHAVLLAFIAEVCKGLLVLRHYDSDMPWKSALCSLSSSLGFSAMHVFLGSVNSAVFFSHLIDVSFSAFIVAFMLSLRSHHPLMVWTLGIGLTSAARYVLNELQESFWMAGFMLATITIIVGMTLRIPQEKAPVCEPVEEEVSPRSEVSALSDSMSTKDGSCLIVDKTIQTLSVKRNYSV